MIGSELMGGRTAKRDSVRTEAAYPLGILGCFGIMALVLSEYSIIFTLLLEDTGLTTSYLDEVFGPNKVSLEQYLRIFNIALVPQNALAGTAEFTRYVKRAPDKILLVTGREKLPVVNACFKHFKKRKRMTIQDNGREAKRPV